MKDIFLTSSPNGPRDEHRARLDNSNGFADRLKAAWQTEKHILLISSSPEDHNQSEMMRKYYSIIFKNEGLPFASFNILDYTDTVFDPKADLIMLSGGPTFRQGMFFQEIGLRERLKDYNGMIIGISAGTMNSADTVYAQPEEPEQLTDPDYKRFYTGLGLTKKQILPHYQEEKDTILGGKRLYEEITYEDSMGHEFLAFPDGTYLHIRDGSEEICGPYYIVKDGKIQV